MSNIEIYDQPQPGKDYIVQFKVKNGPLLRALRIRGFKNGAQLARAAGISNNMIGDYLALKFAPIDKLGRWKESALKLARCLRLPPDSLFPQGHLTEVLSKGSGELEVSRDELMLMLESSEEKNEELSEAIDKVVDALPPRERDIIKGFFGFDGEPQTCTDMAAKIGLSKGRVAQILHRALRKLQHPSRLIPLADAGCVRAQESVRYFRQTTGNVDA